VGKKEQKLRAVIAIQEPADKGWILTYTGRKVYPLDPKPSQLDIEDIAHALSNTCRFTGHCREFYSVAQHSVLVSQMSLYLAKQAMLVNPETVAFHGLLHDATEAYLCDIARPVKRTPEFLAYRLAEDALWEAVAIRYNLTFKHPSIVKLVDEKIVSNEALLLMPTLPPDWQIQSAFTDAELAAAGVDMKDVWTPKVAKSTFLATHEVLFEQVAKIA
jgi:hypothetical protein